MMRTVVGLNKLQIIIMEIPNIIHLEKKVNIVTFIRGMKMGFLAMGKLVN